MKRFQIMLPEPMMTRLKDIADEKGVSTSEIIRYVLDGYLESRERQDHKDLLEFRKTGVV